MIHHAQLVWRDDDGCRAQSADQIARIELFTQRTQQAARALHEHRVKTPLRRADVREDCRQRALAIGPATLQVVEDLLAHRPEDRLRSAGRVVHLALRTSPVRLEQACTRALAYASADYGTIRRILDEGLEAQPLVPLVPSSPLPPRYTFVRSAAEFVAALVGGGR